MSGAPVVYLDEARCLNEARKVLAHADKAVLWSKTIKWYQAGFGVTVRVELSRDLVLRVVNPKTGEVLCEGSALTQKRD